MLKKYVAAAACASAALPCQESLTAGRINAGLLCALVGMLKKAGCGNGLGKRRSPLPRSVDGWTRQCGIVVRVGWYDEKSWLRQRLGKRRSPLPRIVDGWTRQCGIVVRVGLYDKKKLAAAAACASAALPCRESLTAERVNAGLLCASVGMLKKYVAAAACASAALPARSVDGWARRSGIVARVGWYDKKSWLRQRLAQAPLSPARIVVRVGHERER